KRKNTWRKVKHREPSPGKLARNGVPTPFGQRLVDERQNDVQPPRISSLLPLTIQQVKRPVPTMPSQDAATLLMALAESLPRLSTLMAQCLSSFFLLNPTHIVVSCLKLISTPNNSPDKPQ
ncbi:unnamed protein product, partial [Hymenolepis diminuta]